MYVYSADLFSELFKVHTFYLSFKSQETRFKKVFVTKKYSFTYKKLLMHKQKQIL